MLLPPGQGKSKEFNSSYIRFDQLLKDLWANRFSGYLRLTFWGYEGVLIFDTGKIIQAYSSEPDNYMIGEKAVLRIMEKGSEDEGEIVVVPLASEVAISLSFSLNAQSFGDQTNVEKCSVLDLLQFAEKENISGYADLQFSAKKGAGTIYFLDGIAIESVLMASSGKMAAGKAVLDKFIEIGDLVQPTILINRAPSADAIIEDKAFLIPWKHKREIQFWEDVLNAFNSFLYPKHIKKNIFELLEAQCEKIAPKYPVFDRRKNLVSFQNSKLQLNRLLPREEFLSGLEASLHEIMKNVQKRRFRKPSLHKLTKNILQMFRQSEISRDRFDIKNFLTRVFGELEQ